MDQALRAKAALAQVEGAASTQVFRGVLWMIGGGLRSFEVNRSLLQLISGTLWSMRAEVRGVLLFLSLALPGVVAGGCSTKQAAADAPPMMLRMSAPLPDVSGVDQDGKLQKLKDHVGSPVLVYFYPKDGTPGCTKEACAFRDVWERFERKQVYLLGVSSDDQASHEQFAREHRIPFPLIADVSSTWANAFGVPNRSGRYARVSFLFDRTGHLARVYPSVDPGVHADAVLRDIEALPKQ